MFTSPSARAASAYRTLSLQGHTDGASPHQLVSMLFDAVLVSVGGARVAIGRRDVPGKGEQIGKAVRILDEGLKATLNPQSGGELAVNLRNLYDYCISRLTYANLHNDDEALAEVVKLIEPVAQGWKSIGPEVAAMPAAPVLQGA
ncbi:MAG: flagellar export chaperone FliS [Rubrivivax sp.]|nr:MAG: flagellar export chaperone FliS [Rubrivivax sp.]